MVNGADPVLALFTDPTRFLEIVDSDCRVHRPSWTAIALAYSAGA